MTALVVPIATAPTPLACGNIRWFACKALASADQERSCGIRRRLPTCHETNRWERRDVFRTSAQRGRSTGQYLDWLCDAKPATAGSRRSRPYVVCRRGAASLQTTPCCCARGACNQPLKNLRYTLASPLARRYAVVTNTHNLAAHEVTCATVVTGYIAIVARSIAVLLWYGRCE